MSDIAVIGYLRVHDAPLHRGMPNSAEFVIPDKRTVLSADETRELRDALTEWLQRIGRDER